MVEYIVGAAAAWLVGFTPFLEVYLAVPAGLAAGLGYFSTVLWSVLGNFAPVLLIAFAYDQLMRFERLKGWMTGRRSERVQRSMDRYGGWATLLVTPWVGIWVAAATAQALGMKRSVLIGFSLASIVFYGVLVAVAIALGIEFLVADAG